MPIHSSQKKRNAELRQKQNRRRLVIDPMVNPGSPAHRRQAGSKANPTRPHHRMVTLAQTSPSSRTARALQSEKATVMIGESVRRQAGRTRAGPEVPRRQRRHAADAGQA